MAEIFVYSGQSLGEARQDLEDDLEALLGAAGQCTGGGSGEAGWNIDLEVYEAAALEAWGQRIVAFLRERPVPPDTYLILWPSQDKESRIDVFGGQAEA